MQPDLTFFDRSAAFADRVIGTVRTDQFDLPTPCEGWKVRTVVEHMTSGCWNVAHRIDDSLAAPPADPPGGPPSSADELAAYRQSVRALSAAFARPELSSSVYPGPFGPMPGPVVVRLRGAELLVHAWDVARATSQPTDFDPDLVATAAAFFRQAPALPRGAGAPFGPEQPVPVGATDADRLAAFLGRRLQST